MCGHYKNEHAWTQKSVSKLAFLAEGFFEFLGKDVVPVKNALAGSMRQRVGSSRQEMSYIPNARKSQRNADAPDAVRCLTTMMK